MPSLIYNHALDSMARGILDLDSGTFKVMLTLVGYAENKDTHEDKADVTNEVTGGGLTGYTAGGATSAVTVTQDNTNDRIQISLGGSTWTTSAGGTLTARKAVWYLATGTDATSLLVAVNDFGSDQIASNGGTLTLPASTITILNT